MEKLTTYKMSLTEAENKLREVMDDTTLKLMPRVGSMNYPSFFYAESLSRHSRCLDGAEIDEKLAQILDVNQVEHYAAEDGGLIALVTSNDDNDDFIIEIELKDGQSGYDAVGQYIRRYWKRNNIVDDVIVSIDTSYDGNTYNSYKEIASPRNYNDIEFLYDWWEGERFIKLRGIKSVNELEIYGGIYELK